MNQIALAIHGGAGRLAKSKTRYPIRSRYEEALAKALRAGQTVLLKGGSAENAVVAAVTVLENEPLFNAGHGAAICSDGSVELCASVMNGKDLGTGAVVGLKRTKNPVQAAQLLINHSHVFLFGESGDNYAENLGLVMKDEDYFKTPHRLKQLEKIQKRKTMVLDHSDSDNDTDSDTHTDSASEKHAIEKHAIEKHASENLANDETKTVSHPAESSQDNDADEDSETDKLHSTVGAVAMDRNGTLAAATSTGGLLNQLPGRVGDSPVNGAGNWADNKTCAISATGTGEAFARVVFARRIADLIELKGTPTQQAAEQTLDDVKALNGEGGCIIIDKSGQIVLPFNTSQMLRGWVTGHGNPIVAILPDEAVEVEQES